MGRGKSWDSKENEVLARAWISASEDPIAGTDQTAKRFVQTVRRRFIEKGPDPSDVTEGRYGYRSAISIRQHFSDLSADVQKFSLSLSKVQACNPTGVGDDGIISMAVAIHTGQTTTMDYAYKGYCGDMSNCNWISYKAYNVLKHHPKWSSQSTVIPATQSLADVDKDTQPETPETPSTECESPKATAKEPGKKSERFAGGSRGAKLARQEEIRTQSVRSMAASMKRKSEIMEERNAIEVFYRPEAVGLQEPADFFAAVRATQL